MEDKKVINLTISSDDITCKICNEQMIDCKILPCAHRICEYCINCMIANETKLACPFCRKSFTKDVRTDIFLKNILLQMEYKLPCETVVVGCNINEHKKDCIKCVKHDLEKMKSLCEQFLHKKALPVVNSDNESNNILMYTTSNLLRNNLLRDNNLNANDLRLIFDR